MVAAYAAAKGLDLIAFVGTELADAMREAAITMGYSEDRVARFADAHAAASVLGPILRADDLVLVKASRAAGLDAFVEEVLQ
jgi:UDP-N-acetylmuramoyl-tripeptide--D-alanyl-D-alanine ligase